MPGSKKAKTLSPLRLLSTCVMLFCLTLLTSMNFFLYSIDGTQKGEGEGSALYANAEECENNNYPPAGPSEDKSANAGFSFSEEILHESDPEFNFSTNDFFFLHHIADAEKIEMVHPERMLPPPKL